MSFAGKSIIPYSIHLSTPFRSSGNRIMSREGFYVKISDGTGLWTSGDAAPMPEIGTESHAVCRKTLDDLDELLPEFDTDAATIRSIHRLFTGMAQSPAARFAAEQAALTLVAKRRQHTLPGLLKLSPAQFVPVNGLVGLLEPDGAAEEARFWIDRGCTTVKLKGGRPDFRDDLKCLESVRKLSDTLKIRIDVNGTWDTATATEAIGAFEDFNLEYIEQPFPVADIDSLKRLRETTDMKFALDESVVSLDAAVKLIESRIADILIVKPVLCGGIVESMRIIYAAGEHNIPVVVSSVFESLVGWSAVCMLAASAGDAYAHGLAPLLFMTGQYEDAPFEFSNGGVRLQDQCDFIFDPRIAYDG